MVLHYKSERMTKIKYLHMGQNVEELREWDDVVIVENNLRVFTQQSDYVCANEILLKETGTDCRI